MTSPTEAITLETRGKIAIITLNLPKKLNALNQTLYYRLSCLLREIAARPDIYITILTGSGRYFSAYSPFPFPFRLSLTSTTNVSFSGADVTATTTGQPTSDSDDDTRRATLKSFVANNLDITNAFYTHPKILITALNGPVIGLSAALIAHSDFIYAVPSAFLLTPFTSLGLVAEGGASVAFVQRLGISKANEALIMSKRITCEELERVGFVNQVFEAGEGFLGRVLEEVEERLGAHLNSESLVRVKALIRKPERRELDVATLAEVMGGLERFVEGVPQEEFGKVGRGEKRHKL